MTVHIETNPSTADLLLFANPQNAAAELSRALEARRMLELVEDGARRADSAFHEALNGHVAKAGGEPLSGLDLGAVLLGGWQRYRDLRIAARTTLERPGTTETVSLAEHTITSRHAPYVDVYVDGRRVTRVEFGIDLSFSLSLMEATVRDGRLMTLGVGGCVASITWSVRGFTVARNERQLGLPRQVGLGRGIPLHRETPQRS
ncbi:hypothetical protein [Sphaerisporangium corydalis]|uniref:Uncharacterized protein n=1 Tax=Sphaerisporangium corydalis TaxID=1441875 RepID=A0ABV9EEM7_9ACTN|nr:hypothetical protein [Sphaerisporangium corydalis]